MGDNGPKNEGRNTGLPEEEFAVSRALRAALPTSRHADMLFDMVVHVLGEEALVYTSPNGKMRRVFRSTDLLAGYVVPWPLLTLSSEPQRIVDLFTLGLPTVEVPERDAVAPKLRGLKPGHVIVHDGPNAQQIFYREDGLWKETVRTGPSGAMSALLEALRGDGRAPAERVADYVVANDIGRHGPGRLHWPAPLPGGPEAAWSRGLRMLRAGLHEHKLPSTPGWLVADGYDGSATAAAPSQEEALSRWQEAVRRRQPRPPQATPPAPFDGDLPPAAEPWATGSLEGGSWQVEGDDAPKTPPAPSWPEPAPSNTPFLLVSLEPCPWPDHPWGSWVRMLGPHGESVFALRRSEPAGFTLVGQDVVPLLDLERLEETLEGIDAAMPPLLHREGEEWKGEPEYASAAATYRVTQEGAGGPAHLALAQWSSGDRFDAYAFLDGSRLRDHVFRQRWH
jgi:hypothetical protein